MIVEGNIVDILKKEIYPGAITVRGGKIEQIEKNEKFYKNFILPGFVDSHVHIESSMLVPSEFAKMAVVHGTVATVSDPHEIANVCGMQGIEYMIENGKTVPFKFYFGTPSCVPATVFETAGAKISVEDIQTLMQRDEIKYLAEMMNFPGVLMQENDVMQKLKTAQQLGKPIDGHAPGLKGADAKKYIYAGDSEDIVISTDHECFTYEEALGKLKLGMKILIREGSAAKNFDALIDLLNDYPHQMMFCSDDKHPDSLELGHINLLCARAVQKGIPIFSILQAACVNPVQHYKLSVGLLQPGDDADFILVEDLINFKVQQTFINGAEVASLGISKITTSKAEVINNFNITKRAETLFRVEATHLDDIPIIEALDGQLITNKIFVKPHIKNDFYETDVERDILKIAVVNRYAVAPVSIGFIKNFGLKNGAIASSVAHDSHNIVVVGVDDKSMAEAVNLIISTQGGLSAVGNGQQQIIPLPVAGLMSNEDGYAISKAYTKIDTMAKGLGSTLQSPFMTLSFMALLVIPALKLSDKGLFDGEKFDFVEW